MTFQVYEGRDAKEAERLQEYELLMLASGCARRTIFLNGGSDTRRASREYWREYAESLGVGFKATGYSVEIGGPA